ncbi:MAG: hypothetical protein K2J85_06765 [Anaeroplasmataceae bacterium]|nr:hypothetical protein [Anaeroplasmataceae bacterium]
MKKKFFLCLSIFLGILAGSITISANNNQGWTKEDCEDSISFIKTHINEFVLKYNETEEMNEKLNASYVEYSTLLWLVEDDNYGVYIDFDGDNGYLVMTGDYTIYSLQTTGDYPEYRNEENLYFSHIDGFLFQDNNGDYQKYGNKITMFPATSVPSTGTKDGNITSNDLDAHVKQYHSYYTLESVVQPFSKTFKYSYQVNTSYYISYETDSEGNILNEFYPISEGNCSTNSCFALLSDWQKRGYISGLPEGSIDKRGDIKNDWLYESYGPGNVWLQTEDDQKLGFEAGKYYRRVCNNKALIDMPMLYDEIRTYAVEKLNYTPVSGLNYTQIKELMYFILAKYGNQVTLRETDTISTAVIQINNNRASYISVSNSFTYLSHAMVVVGYRKYSYESGWWVFKTKHFAYYLEVADGWSSNRSYFFDPYLNAELDVNFIYLN